LSRGNYIDKYEESLTAHDGEVAGIACDSTNSLLISAGYHGDVKVNKKNINEWQFCGVYLHLHG
jgi:hypothetical protein